MRKDLTQDQEGAVKVRFRGRDSPFLLYSPVFFFAFGTLALLPPRRPPKRPPQSTILNPNAKNTSPAQSQHTLLSQDTLPMSPCQMRPASCNNTKMVKGLIDVVKHNFLCVPLKRCQVAVLNIQQKLYVL